MPSSTRTNQRRTRRRTERDRRGLRETGHETDSRNHVRPLEPESGDAPQRPRRMMPRSQTQAQARSQPLVGSASSSRVTPRRSTGRARRSAQVQRPRSRTRRRTINPTRLLSWRAVSGMIVVGLTAVLYLFLTLDEFYVSAVAIGGERYMTREEIFRFSDVAQRHIFWVDPAKVAARLETVPNIADAQVYVGWPPDMVQIIVTEREPALIWEQGVRVWVDVNGIVMKQREDQPDLLRIVVPNAGEPITVGARIPQNIITGALYMRSRHPNVDVLLYDSLKGLGYHDGRGWTVWFGSGADMETKLLTYNALVSAFYDKVQFGEVVMSDPDRPYYTVLWRKQ
ncbi:MAG: FtsQ-type POTRA domain-containing protein [Anaerolineae bacterium]|nr:FtsQ-type POTRA domain-containing protein [Anaerolineae bacterium]